MLAEALLNPKSKATATGGVVMLVDYDNVFVGADTTARLRNGIDQLIQVALDWRPEASRLVVRLYGGWLEEHRYTNRASQLQQDLSTLRLLPLPHPRRPGILRGNVELATRMHISSEIEWGHTLRRRSGLPRLRVADPFPPGCLHGPADCPAHQLQRFTKKNRRICTQSGCTVSSDEAFSTREQKMVDMMLCCDMLAFVAIGSDVLLASGDLDVLPAVAMASSLKQGSVALVRGNAPTTGLYDDLLDALGVAVSDLERI